VLVHAVLLLLYYLVCILAASKMHPSWGLRPW
jgi:hypothetical protein